jgi:RNA-binding protein
MFPIGAIYPGRQATSLLDYPLSAIRHPLPMLSDAQRKYLRRLGHDRNPIVLVGQGGISPNLVTELDRALNDHELVKVRARVGDRDLRDQILDQLATATGSELVQRIGHVALYYRPNKEKPGILLPG